METVWPIPPDFPLQQVLLYIAGFACTRVQYIQLTVV